MLFIFIIVYSYVLFIYSSSSLFILVLFHYSSLSTFIHVLFHYSSLSLFVLVCVGGPCGRFACKQRQVLRGEARPGGAPLQFPPQQRPQTWAASQTPSWEATRSSPSSPGRPPARASSSWPVHLRAPIAMAGAGVEAATLPPPQVRLTASLPSPRQAAIMASRTAAGAGVVGVVAAGSVKGVVALPCSPRTNPPRPGVAGSGPWAAPAVTKASPSPPRDKVVTGIRMVIIDRIGCSPVVVRGVGVGETGAL